MPPLTASVRRIRGQGCASGVRRREILWETENARFAFFAVNSLFNLASSFAHPVTPTVIQELVLPDYMFGLALAVMMTTMFLFSPFWGKINAILSSRVCLLISCTGYAVGQLMFGLARGWPRS